MDEFSEKTDVGEQVVSYLRDLLEKPHIRETPAELSALGGFEELKAYIQDIKEALLNFSRGEFDHVIKRPGATAGLIKALQSNIRHLAWQCHAVSDGNLNQKVNFLGDLSKAFNLMTEALADKQREILNQQAALTKKTEELQIEIKKKEEMAATLRASEEMYRQRSLHDPLTGLYNRAYFFETVAREIETLKRQQNGHCCLVVLDIDFFKTFNDSCGHLFGDQAIKTVASVISGALRKSDIFARYGGDEFAAFLPQADLGRGSAIADRIRNAVFNCPPHVPENQTPLTVSVGLCHIDTHGAELMSSGDLILVNAFKAADAALYIAKEKGRNMVWASSLPG